MSNFAVRDIITRGQQYPRGQVAAYLSDFERRKRRLDWMDLENSEIHLNGKDTSPPIIITADELKQLFDDTFGEIHAICEQEIRRAIEDFEKLVVVYCGGSYLNLGYRRKTHKLMDRIVAEAEAKGVQLKHVLLADYDTNPSSAVSIGAALSVLDVPDPDEVFGGSAMGIHVLRQSETKWVGESTAKFLLGKGCGPQRHVDYVNKIAFKIALVCDPNYYPKRPPPNETNDRLRKRRKTSRDDTPFKPIKIDPLTKARSMGTYDMGFGVLATDLPQGKLRFRINGADADRLADDTDARGSPKRAVLMLQVTCLKINGAGDRVYDILDKRWLLRVKTDPSTKLLVVDEQKELPAWCGKCRQDMLSISYVCKMCEGFHVCMDCYSSAKATHDKSHEWESREAKFENDDL